MVIREYTESDMEQVKELHGGCGYDYPLPDLNHPSVVVRRVMDTEDGIKMAAFLKLTAEAYLICDSVWKTPAYRWVMLQKMQEDVQWMARSRNLEDVCCWVPKELEQRFGKRLEVLGWEKHPWPSYSRSVL